MNLFLWKRLFAIILVSSIILLLAGILTLLIRLLLKRKKQNKYILSKVMGIIFICLGILLPSGFFLLHLFSNPTKIIDFLEDHYYNQYVETDKKLDVSFFEITGTGEFLYDGENYQLIPTWNMTVKLFDRNRDDAVFNLERGESNAYHDEITAFSYEDPSGADLICIQNRIYCRESDCEKLFAYYNSSEPNFQYYYMDVNDSSLGAGIKMEFSDEWFGQIMEYNEKYVTLCSKDSYRNYETAENLETECSYFLEQRIPGKNYYRSCTVYVTSMGDVYLSLFSDLFTNENSYFTYRVTDEALAAELIHIGEAITTA